MPTTGWIATANGVDESVAISEIFAEFGDVPQFTLHSLDMTVEMMRNLCLRCSSPGALRRAFRTP